MRKPEIQPLVPFILGRGKVIFLLILAHAAPNLLPLAIDAPVKVLGPQEQCDVVGAEGDEDFVAGEVVGFVRGAVDL
jgi:hypothetical protein